MTRGPRGPRGLSGGAPKYVRDLRGYLDSMAIDQPELTIVVDSTHVYLDIEAVDGGNISFYLAGTRYTLDCTTGDGVDGKARIEIPQGTSILDKFSVVYVTNVEEGIILVASEQLPIGSFMPLCYLSIQDYATVDSTGPIVFQRTTECITHGSEGHQGAISRMRENTRLVQGGGYWSGLTMAMTITTNGAARDNIGLTFTRGVIYQMNRQSFPGYDISSLGIMLAGMNGTGTHTNLQKLTDLGLLSETSEGDALIDGDILIIDIFANINKTEDDCKLFAVPYHKVFRTDSEAENIANGSTFAKIPDTMRTVGTPLYRLVMKYNTANSGTWTNILSTTQWVWKSNSANVKSPNYPSNYSNNANDTNYINAPAGTTQIIVNFNAFNTEANYDYVRLYDQWGTLRFTYHGNLGANWQSGAIPGNQVKVVFTSDGSVTRPGFYINSYQYYIEDVATSGESIDRR